MVKEGERDFEAAFESQMKLLRKIKDIQDELHMVKRVLIQQKELVGTMNSMEGLYSPKSAPLVNSAPLVWTSRIDDVTQLDADAIGVEDSVSGSF